MRDTQQPTKHDASDLTFLYDFVSACPHPQISEFLKRLVAAWLKQPTTLAYPGLDIQAKLGLTNEEVLEVAWLLAINPHTPPAILRDLCIESSPELLERIAENRRSWPTTLATLSCQALAEIRIAAASNPSTPVASVVIMVHDENPDVRFSLAEDTNLPAHVLSLLARDDNPFVKLRAETTLKRLDLNRRLMSAQESFSGN